MKEGLELIEDGILADMLAGVDTEKKYISHVAGYHMYDPMQVLSEWSSRKITVYIPNAFRPAPINVKREIFKFAYLKSLGSEMPAYGPKTLAFLVEMGGLRESDLRKMMVHMQSRGKLKKLGYSDWAVSQLCGATCASGLNYETLEVKDISTTWGRRNSVKLP